MGGSVPVGRYRELVNASRAALRAGCAAFVAFGSTTATFGPILPGIRRDLHAGDVASGTFLGLAGGGFGIGVLASAPVQHRWGRQRSFRVGLLSLAVGAVLVAASPSIVVATVGAALASFGGGLLGGSVNAAMAGIGTHELSIANAAFGVGAIAGPLVTAALVASGASWRLAPLLGGALACASLPLERHLPDGRRGEPGGRAVLPRLLGSRVLLLLVAVMALQMFGEAGLIGWLPVYLVDVRSAPQWLAATSTTLFWTGQAVARGALVRTRLAERPMRRVPVLQALIAAAVLAVIVIDGTPVALLLAFLAGLAAGPVFPLALSAARDAFPADLDAATAMLLGIGGLTEMLLPLGLGAASSAAGTTAAGIAAVATAFAVAATVAALVWRATATPG
jgi:fucose permease